MHGYPTYVRVYFSSRGKVQLELQRLFRTKPKNPLRTDLNDLIRYAHLCDHESAACKVAAPAEEETLVEVLEPDPMQSG
eukprot:580731-Ditylum_brightwellii.AAC.1